VGDAARVDGERSQNTTGETALINQGAIVSDPKKAFTTDEARTIGEEIGINWASAPFDVEQFRVGMDVELEHGLHDLLTNVTDDDPHVTAKIALAHLNEFPDYYTRLEQMEEQAKRDWAARRSN